MLEDLLAELSGGLVIFFLPFFNLVHHCRAVLSLIEAILETESLVEFVDELVSIL